MIRERHSMLLLWSLAGLLGLGMGQRPLTAADAPSTHRSVSDATARLRAAATPAEGQPAGPDSAAWAALADSVDQGLAAYQAAPDDAARRAALDGLAGTTATLRTSAWAPAQELASPLDDWSRPRRGLLDASTSLTETIGRLPATADPNVQANRQRWVELVDRLRDSFRTYDTATTVRDRLDGLEAIRQTLDTMDQVSRSAPWLPALQLRGALSSLFERPNLEAVADLPTVAAFLEKDVATTGPITRNGQVSYVTAGAKTGFGLLPSDDGLVFYNRQQLTSVTPIRGFQQQVAADPQGRRAAELYCFSATSNDFAELTIVGALRPSGLSLSPSSTHATQVTLGSQPTQGKGLVRLFAGLLGQDQQTILSKVYQGAVGEIKQGVIEGANAEQAERVGQAQAEQNAQLANVLIGNNTAALAGQLGVSRLDIRSRPSFAWVRGNVEWLDGQSGLGADASKPPQFAQTEPGVTTDVHLTSLLTNLSRGFLDSPKAQGVQNVLLTTKAVPEGAPASSGVTTTPNADYAAFLSAIDASRAANDPKATAIRIRKPEGDPQFAVDAKGNLVAIVPNLTIEVPAPPPSGLGNLLGGGGANNAPPARVFRLEAPRAEFAVSLNYTPWSVSGPAKMAAKIESFDPGPGTKLTALGATEDEATPVNALTTAVVLGVFRARVQGQPIEVPLDQLPLTGFAITSISPLDPSGWMRVVLSRTQTAPTYTAAAPSPAPYVQPVQVAQPAPVYQPTVYQQAR
jgi:hypothetical protein